MNKKTIEMNLIQLPTELKEAASAVLNDITPEMKNSFSNNLVELIELSLSAPGKVNYTQLGRIGRHTEKTYRNTFTKEVDWPSINSKAVFKVFSPQDHLSIVIDPSFIHKSGDHTPCTGLYWSGVAGAMKHGLEINAIGVSDIEKHDCMIMTTELTPAPELLKDTGTGLRQWYLMTIASCHEELEKISNLVTADSFFATAGFCDGLNRIGFSLVSRLRDNACLKYIHTQQPDQKPSKGRPRLYDGKVDIDHPDVSVFREFTLPRIAGRFLTATVYSQGLERDIVISIYYPPLGKPKIFFSSDLSISGEMVAQSYFLRFQIEFCIRDAKQFCGLEDSQSRNYKAMKFAYNLSFTALNMAKLIIHKENLDISVGQFHRILLILRIAEGFNPRYAETLTPEKISLWNRSLCKLAGIDSISA